MPFILVWFYILFSSVLAHKKIVVAIWFYISADRFVSKVPLIYLRKRNTGSPLLSVKLHVAKFTLSFPLRVFYGAYISNIRIESSHFIFQKFYNLILCIIIRYRKSFVHHKNGTKKFKKSSLFTSSSNWGCLILCSILRINCTSICTFCKLIKALLILWCIEAPGKNPKTAFFRI